MKKENTYIMNLEAAYIYKDIQDGKKITYKQRDLNKLFSATTPYSLENIRIDKMFPNTFYIVNKKQYTRKIINLTFDKNYTVWDEENNKRKTIASKKKIRSYLYNNGFIMDGIKYVFYKRGSGKAKNGYALFIQEEMKEPLLTRSRLGLIFKQNEDLDLTSLLAYESLISSGIDFTIELDPKTEILLIDDIYGKEFESLASVTREVDGEIVTKNEKILLQNCLTDGQGLLDESVFEKYEKQDHAFMLLRNDMFKCCAFHTKLQKWFEYNGVTEVKDMFGNIYDASKIKLITTPNSLKFLKFAYKIGSGTKKECYQHWIDNVESTFGVVKCDKDTNYGNYNRTTYQLLNSIPNLTYDDLLEITRHEREYVTLLKNNDAVFRNYIIRNSKLGQIFNESIDEGDMSSFDTMDLMNSLILVNSDIQNTRKFKTIKSELISNYVNNLKRGKLRLKDTKYVTLFSNPYEMLLTSIGEYKQESIMAGREIYCPYYKRNQEFCASRNPHVNSGNVMNTTNIYHKEYDDWFKFTDNICAINFFDNDAPDRLQGCDVDSDQILLLPSEILVEKAKYCEEHFSTPINRVKGKSAPRKNNMKQLQKLDVVLSNNYIGKIVNLSQIINSYMNDAIYRGEPFEVIDELYQLSSRLSSMSQIEIDKSKKIFDNVNMSKEIAKIKNNHLLTYIHDEDSRGNIVKKMVIPTFFQMILMKDSIEYKVFEKFNTPLDILQDVLVFPSTNRTKNIEFKDLLIQPNETDDFYNNHQIKIVFDIVSKYGKKINGLKTLNCKLGEKAKATVRRKEKDNAIHELNKYKINLSTVLNILRRCFGISKDEFGFSRFSIQCLNLLFITNKLEVLKCFRNENVFSDKILVKSTENSYDFNIFGEYFLVLENKNA